MSFNHPNSTHLRTKLPCPMIPRDQISVWSILKNCIGKELYKITMPVVFNEPLTMLQRACESVQHIEYLTKADNSDDPIERMEYVCGFIVASISANCYRLIKPFNPLLYETYELHHVSPDGTIARSISQQVSHHPPITASHVESDHFTYCGSINPKLKFWGGKIEVHPDGQCEIHLKRHKESYVFKSISCAVHNIIVGTLWFEHVGPLDIVCADSGLQANLNFRSSGWFGNDLHKFDGFIANYGKSKEKKSHRYVYGKWSDYIMSVDYREYENFVKHTLRKKPFRIPENPGNYSNTNGISQKLANLSLGNSSDTSQIPAETPIVPAKNIDTTPLSESSKSCNTTESTSSRTMFVPNSRLLWRSTDVYLKDYFNFTQFTLRMNELTDDLKVSLPKTDSRFRMDVRKLEEGDLEGAAREKDRLEEKQRAARAKDPRFKDPSPDFLWFELTKVDYSSEKFWRFKGDYWEKKCKEENFPDLFGPD